MNGTNFTSPSADSIALTFGVINTIFGIFGLILNISIFSIFIAGKNTYFKHRAYFWMIFLAACDTIECLVLGIYIGVGSVVQSDLGPVVSSAMIWMHWTFENSMLYYDIFLGADRVLTICYRFSTAHFLITSKYLIWTAIVFFPVCAGIGAVFVVYPPPVFGFVPADFGLEYLSTKRSEVLPAISYSIASEMFSYSIQVIFTLRVCREVWLVKQLLVSYKRKSSRSCNCTSSDNFSTQMRLFIQFAAPSCANVLLAVIWYSVRYSNLNTSAIALGASNTARWVFTSIFRSLFYIFVNKDLQQYIRQKILHK